MIVYIITELPGSSYSQSEGKVGEGGSFAARMSRKPTQNRLKI